MKYFPDRDSQTIVTPFKNNIDQKNMRNLMIDEFVSDFQNDVESFKKKIFKDINGKKIKGKKLNGFTLGNLIEEFIDALNNNNRPDMSLM